MSLKITKPRISVIGLGFVGLILAVMNAYKGFSTVAIDIDRKKVQTAEKGNPHFFEPKLTKFLQKAIERKKINFTTNFKAVLNTDITFITVGTPSSKTGEINLDYLRNAIMDLVKVLKNKKTPHLVVIKSTIVPMTTIDLIFPKFRKFKNICLVVNPEFLREGSAIDDLLKPHLIVIGENNKKAGDKLIQYYKIFYSKLPEILRTDFTTSEMIKYTNNAFLATKLSFINSIANICQKIPNADVKTISYAIGKDPRIGPLFLNAGPGFGGSCLPKDLSALIKFSDDIKNNNPLLKAVEIVNQEQPIKIIDIMKKMKVFKKNKIVAVLGLAFKKNTDDVRSSVSIELVKILIKNGLKVKVHDPYAMKNFKKIFKNKINYCSFVKSCLSRSDCCLILTNWDIYTKLTQNDFKNYMNTPMVIDARRILDPKKFTKINFKALGLG